MADKKDEKKDAKKETPKSADVFNLDGIRLLVELMKEANVSELDLKQGESRLKLRRGNLATAVAPIESTNPVAGQVAQLAQLAQTAVPTATPSAASSPSQPASDDSAFVKTIDSPMVGTFYASSSPDSPAFVKVGDVVGPEKTVCIVEAMKVFNEIQAETNGKIVAVLAKSGDAVEYGTPLFKIDVRG